MIKTKKNCKVCQTILAQPKKWEGRLAKRIYGSRYYMPSSDYSLKTIAEEYKDKFGYESLLNHAKKHQFLSEKDFNERHLRQTAREAEKVILKEAIKSQQVWDRVIQKSMEKLENNELELTATHLLKAANDKSNYELKHAGQQMAMMEMVFHFASGATAPGVREGERDAIEGETVGAAQQFTDDSERRTAQSRAFYESLAGDAAASGAD